MITRDPYFPRSVTAQNTCKTGGGSAVGVGSRDWNGLYEEASGAPPHAARPNVKRTKPPDKCLSIVFILYILTYKTYSKDR